MMSVPRDRPLARVLATWTVALAVAGCGGETPLAIVTGQVESSVEIVSANAWQAETLVASSPVDAEGRFVLAVPPSTGLELVLSTTDGTPAPVLIPIEVCSADATIALGTLIPVDEGEQCPDVGAECALAQSVVSRCLGELGVRCEATMMELRDCQTTLQAMCEPMRLTFERCIEMATGPCADEHMAWMTCEDTFACAEIEGRIELECANGCEDELALRDVVCTAPVGCSPRLAFVPRDGFVSPGCETGAPEL